MMKAVLLLCMLSLASCSNAPPGNISDSCEIFREKDDWYDDALDSYQRWGVPIHVQLAIIHQESRFMHDAKTELEYFLWLIPTGRKSSAYGYAQAKDETWDWYMESTDNRGADRDDFADAVDFIGWYGRLSYDMLDISRWDAYNQYLAYHEGHGGFKRKTYKKKPWLMKVARKVDNRAKSYHTQLAKCEDSLDRGWWPF